jgi:hypothetical protein
MSHKRLQRRSLRFARLSVLGDGLPERLRSTSFALLGIATAAGLGMMALTLQQGFPLVTSSPISDPPPQREALLDRVVATQTGVAPRGDVTPARASDDGRSAPSHDVGGVAPTASTPSVGSGGLVTGSPPAGGEGTDRKRPPIKAPQSSPIAVEAPTVAPPKTQSAISPDEVPEPAPEQVPPSHPGNGNAYGQGNGNAYGKDNGKDNGKGNGNAYGKGLGNSGSPPGQETSEQARGQPDE